MFLVCKVCLDELSRRLYNMLKRSISLESGGIICTSFFSGAIKAIEQSLF